MQFDGGSVVSGTAIEANENDDSSRQSVVCRKICQGSAFLFCVVAPRHVCRVHGRCLCVNLPRPPPPPFGVVRPTHPTRSRAPRSPWADICCFLLSLALRCSHIQPAELEESHPLSSTPPLLPTTAYWPRSLCVPPLRLVCGCIACAISCAPCLPRLGNTSRPSRTSSGTITSSSRTLHRCRRCLIPPWSLHCTIHGLSWNTWCSF